MGLVQLKRCMNDPNSSITYENLFVDSTENVFFPQPAEMALYFAISENAEKKPS